MKYLLCLLLTGCAVFEPAPYIWFPAGKPLDRVVWEKHPHEHIRHACDFENSLHNKIAGCVKRLNNSGNPYCLVLSTLSEQEAKQTPPDHEGKTHYQHEKEEHCEKGLNHIRGTA